MPTPVVLPHGKTIDLDTVTVIRTVGEKESDNFNERMAQMPGANGVIPSRRWTVALEMQGERGIVTRYTASDAGEPALTVKGLVERLGEAGRRFALVDGARAAIDAKAQVHLIRPLAQRDGASGQATIWVEGGSGNGLVVGSSADEIRQELGARASHLKAIGAEGFIDPRRIERISSFDPTKELAEGQQRFTTAVKFKGVGRPQYFRAEAVAITGSAVIDTRAGAQRPAGGPAATGKAARAPEVR